MKLNLKIKHRNVSTSFVVAVGQGEGTIKWLSLVAAQRYALQVPKGRIRCRERDSYVGSLKHPELLPKNAFTDEIPFLHPDAIINKRLKDGQTVHIELYDNLPTDEYGIPQYSPFAYIAFFVSDARAELREKLTQEKFREAKEFDEMKIREAEEQRIASNRPKLQKMRNIMMEQIGGAEIMSTTVANEWNLIVNSGVLDSMVPSSSEQSAIKDFFTRNYEEMSHMYKYYSAVNSGGGTHTLEYIEYTKFLQETNIFQSLQSNVIIKLFGASPSSIHSEIIQWEFFVSCIKIAIYKYITLAKKKMAALKKRGHHAAIAQHEASTPTQSHALEMLYSEFLQPVIDRLPASTAIKRALDSDEVLIFIHGHLDELTRIFCNYAEGTFNPKDVDGSREAGMMNLQQFTLLATDFGFLGPVIHNANTNSSNNNDTNNSIVVSIALKDVRQVFSASQHDTAMNDAENQLQDNCHMETMVFPEFVEAVVRLGFLKFVSVTADSGENDIEDVRDTDNHFEKVRLAIQKVTSSCPMTSS